MQLFQLAVVTANFRLPLRDALKAAVQMRADGVQLNALNEIRVDDFSETARRQFLNGMTELNLKLASLHLPLKRTLYDQEELDRRLEVIRRSMQLAWQLKAPILTLKVGKIPTDPESKNRILLTDVLRDLARYSNHVGTTLAIIPAGDRAETLRELLTGINEGPLGIDLDPAAMVQAGDSATDALRTLHALVTHIQGRDAVKELDGSGLEVPVGRGDVDWDEFIALLAEIPYRGWVAVNRTQGDERQQETADAVQFFREIGFR